MGAQAWVDPINWPFAVADGAAYASSATITDVSPAPQLVLPANFLYPGMGLRVTAHGRFSNTGTPTLVLGVYFGAVAGVKLAATGATTTTTGATNWPFRLEATIICRTIGATGTLFTTGFVMLATSLTAVSTIPIDAAASAAVTVDTTAAKALTLGATWGTSNAANTLTTHQWIVERFG